MTKHECRELIKYRLQLLSKQRREEAVSKLLKKLSQIKNKNILSFASMKDEINLWPLNQVLLKKNNLYLPKVYKNELKIHQITTLHNLKKSILGVLEPDSSTCSSTSLDKIDIALIPALAFDYQNNRIGYGKGFYDRLLDKFSKDKVGICFNEQILPKIPVKSHDKKVDYFFSF